MKATNDDDDDDGEGEGRVVAAPRNTECVRYEARSRT